MIGSSSSELSTTAPVAPTERVEIIDVLRGFALFGILLVNMPWFANSGLAFLGDFEIWPAAHDKVAAWFIRMFAEGKVYILFSFLFGLGFAMQIERAEARDTGALPLLRKRMLVLAVIGAAHAFLIWAGDILLLYALLGLLLILFRRRSSKALVQWAVALVLLPAALLAGYVGYLEKDRADPETRETIETEFAEWKEWLEAEFEESTRVYREGTYTETTRQRVKELAFFFRELGVFFAPTVLGIFILGLLAGRHHVFADLAPHIPWIRRLRWPALALGLAGNAGITVAAEVGSVAVPGPALLLVEVGWLLGGPALTFFYVATLVLWWQGGRGRACLRLLAPAGRMALTNYLTQSVVCTLIFYNYGLGLIGRMGFAAGIVLTLIIYTLQISLSNWWLRRYRFGPAEWLWRTLTYGRLQPMRHPDAVPASDPKPEGEPIATTFAQSGGTKSPRPVAES